MIKQKKYQKVNKKIILTKIYPIIELKEILSQKNNKKYNLYKTLHCHELPLTNCCFNKNGSNFLTGSYDQTCIIWDTYTGNILQKLQGHNNVVYSVSFNLPYSDKVATGSFDKTAKIWNVSNGQLLSTY